MNAELCLGEQSFEARSDWLLEIEFDLVEFGIEAAFDFELLHVEGESCLLSFTSMCVVAG